jgi:colicin import membrane protein
VVPKPDIALEKQREAKLREEKARLEREEAEKARARKAAAEELARKEEKTRKEEKAKKDEKDRIEKAAKAEKAEKAAKELERKLTEKQEKDRDDYVKRLMEQAGKTTDAPKAAPRPGAAVGAAEGGASGGIDGDYIARLGSMIRSNTTFSAPPELAGNPKAIFTVLLAPDCSILSVKLKRSSGHGAWDQAAERGIARTDPFPRPRSGRCDTELEIARGPRDDR